MAKELKFGGGVNIGISQTYKVTYKGKPPAELNKSELIELVHRLVTQLVVEEKD